MRVSGDQDRASDSADSKELLQAGRQIADVTNEYSLTLREPGRKRLDEVGQSPSFLTHYDHRGAIGGTLTPAGDFADLSIGERLAGIHTKVEALEERPQHVPLRSWPTILRLPRRRELVAARRPSVHGAVSRGGVAPQQRRPIRQRLAGKLIGRPDRGRKSRSAQAEC